MDGAEPGAPQQPPEAPAGAEQPTDVLLRPVDAPGARVALSPKDKAPQVHITDDGLGAQSSKGYRMVRCTHGVSRGAWYCEARVLHLGATGNARLGWATGSADLNGPVGYDKHGYGYRSGGGEKIHAARREPYGAPFGEGDVIGMYLCLGDGVAAQQVARVDGQLYTVEKERRAGPGSCRRSAVAFAVNGVSQGVAYTELCGDVFFAAASLFTEPRQAEPASVVFNFGPDFAFAPPALSPLPAPRPLADLAQPPQTPAVDAAAS